MIKLKPALKDAVLLILSVFVGIFIWALSPVFTGETEPWDSSSGYCPLTLLLSGFLIGFLGPQKPWLWPMGIYLGQFFYVPFIHFFSAAEQA